MSNEELVPSEEVFADLSMDEVRHLNSFINRGKNLQAYAMYVVWKRNGWTAVGYNSFEQYAEQFCEVPKSTAYRWMNRVEISRKVNRWKLSDLYDQFLGRSFPRGRDEIETLQKQVESADFPLLSGKDSETLSRLPDDASRRRVWSAYTKAYPNADNPTKLAETVTEMLKQSKSAEVSTPPVLKMVEAKPEPVAEPEHEPVVIEDRPLTESEIQRGQELMQDPKVQEEIAAFVAEVANATPEPATSVPTAPPAEVVRPKRLRAIYQGVREKEGQVRIDICVDGVNAYVPLTIENVTDFPDWFVEAVCQSVKSKMVPERYDEGWVCDPKEEVAYGMPSIKTFGGKK